MLTVVSISIFIKPKIRKSAEKVVLMSIFEKNINGCVYIDFYTS